DFPRTIIIDEPQSFLHPGAARKLVEILKADKNQHEFIVATHSPTIISAASPKTITVIRHDGTEPNLTTISTQEADQLRMYLAEIGAHLADVFGADYILWVEGATEELCFPRILERLCDQRLIGTVIKGVSSTGDFDSKKHGDRVVDIYHRLTSGTALIPPA